MMGNRSFVFCVIWLSSLTVNPPPHPPHPTPYPDVTQIASDYPNNSHNGWQREVFRELTRTSPGTIVSASPKHTAWRNAYFFAPLELWHPSPNGKKKQRGMHNNRNTVTSHTSIALPPFEHSKRGINRNRDRGGWGGGKGVGGWGGGGGGGRRRGLVGGGSNTLWHCRRTFC